MNDDLRLQLSQLLSSGQFDAEWYVNRYPDVLQTGMGPAEHYLWLGKRMGRRGKPVGSNDELIDIKAFKSRASEGRVTASSQDVSWEKNSGKAQAQPMADVMINALADWPGLDKAFVCYQLGVKPLQSARQVAELYYEKIKQTNILPNALFDHEYYSHMNDIGVSDDEIYHYITSGAKDHLRTSPMFDVEWYIGQYPDAKESADLLTHYWKNGYRDKVLPVDQKKVPVLDTIREVFFADVFADKVSDFDAQTYRLFNNDLASASDADLAAHFKKAGKSEKRVGSLLTMFRDAGLPGHCIPINFDPQQYVSLHVDFVKDFSSNPWHSIQHFVNDGFREKRQYTFNKFLDAKRCPIYGYGSFFIS